MGTIALVSVSVLLSITGLLAPGFMGPPICAASQGMLALLPVAPESKPSLPDFCFQEGRKLERIRLSVETNRELAEKTAYYIDRCWASADSGRYARTFLCYELYSEKSTTEKDITEAMKGQGACGRIGNSVIDATGEIADCGSSNSVSMVQPSVRGTIIVKYESGLHRISVS